MLDAAVLSEALAVVADGHHDCVAAVAGTLEAVQQATDLRVREVQPGIVERAQKGQGLLRERDPPFLEVADPAAHALSELCAAPDPRHLEELAMMVVDQQPVPLFVRQLLASVVWRTTAAPSGHGSGIRGHSGPAAQQV